MAGGKGYSEAIGIDVTVGGRRREIVAVVCDCRTVFIASSFAMLGTLLCIWN